MSINFSDELLTIERLISLHPLSCQLWIKLGNAIYSMLQAEHYNNTQTKREYLAGFFIANVVHNHFFADRGPIVQKQKQQQKIWVINH